jgi:biotin carboxyl carrier protein
LIFDAVVDGRALRVEVRHADGRFAVTLAGRPMQIDYVPEGRHFASMLVEGKSYEVGLEPRAGGYAVYLGADTLEVQLHEASRAAALVATKPAHGAGRVQAPMPGKIVRVLVPVGQQVAAGEGLVVMEAMKMENELRAARAGRVREVRVAEGQAVETGALLVVLE